MARKVLIGSALLILLSALLCTYLKSLFTGVMLSEFNFLFTGNILFFAPVVIALAGVLTLLITGSSILNHQLTSLSVMSTLLLLPLVAAFGMWVFNIKMPDFYLFGFPARKVIYGSLLTSYYFLLIYIASFIWSLVIHRSAISYLRD